MWKITVNFSVLQSHTGFAEMYTYVEKIFLKINLVLQKNNAILKETGKQTLYNYFYI